MINNEMIKKFRSDLTTHIKAKDMKQLNLIEAYTQRGKHICDMKNIKINDVENSLQMLL
jgi:hypothetical protein